MTHQITPHVSIEKFKKTNKLYWLFVEFNGVKTHTLITLNDVEKIRNIIKKGE